jgi:hypothetical protein
MSRPFHPSCHFNSSLVFAWVWLSDVCLQWSVQLDHETEFQKLVPLLPVHRSGCFLGYHREMGSTFRAISYPRSSRYLRDFLVCNSSMEAKLFVRTHRLRFNKIAGKMKTLQCPGMSLFHPEISQNRPTLQSLNRRYRWRLIHEASRAPHPKVL